MFIFKKRFLASLLIGVFIFSIPLANASTTFNLYPLKINVQEGQTFKLAVNVNPNSQKNYTIKVNIDFPADIVTVTSWQFAGSWQPLSQAGYDSIDNNGGTLIKTAGYPGGLDKAATFGTITFKAKKTGTGTVSFVGGSMALDEANTNQYNGGNKVSLSVEKIIEKPVVTNPVVKPGITTTPKPEDITPSIADIASSTELNPPIGEQPEIITIATYTPEIVFPEELKKINTNLTSINLNLSNIASILLIISVLILILFLISLIILIIYIARGGKYRTHTTIGEEEVPIVKKPKTIVKLVKKNKPIVESVKKN